jgi:hypothetical protein
MSELDDMTCAELSDVAAELALGVLTGRERAIAIAHLDRCDGCRDDVRQLMATGEQLLELLPSAEPPAGFETRVLERLGLPVPAPAETRAPAYPQLISRGESGRERRRPATRPGTGQPSAPPAGPGGTRPPGRVRRLLTAAAVGLAVVAAGLGGWSIGSGTAPGGSAASGPLTAASLLSDTHQGVGEIFYYDGKSQWVYMSVDLGGGDERVTCQVTGDDGRVMTVGTFRLTNGYGSWGGSPNEGTIGDLTGARLIAADGAVLATATFTD